MIPKIVLNKLATDEGVLELEKLLSEDSRSIMSEAIIFRGGATDSSLKQREEAVVRVAEKDNKLCFRIEMPSEGNSSSMTVVELSIPLSAYLQIQKVMFGVYSNDQIQKQ